jgi:hypothetical protein
MIKRITTIAVAICLLIGVNIAYGQDKSAAPKAKMETSSDVKVLKIDEFQDAAPELVGKQVEIQGMVVHVCAHGGKKMFLIGSNPDIRVKITASDKVNVFDSELQGSTVSVQGIVEPIAEEEAVAAESVERAETADADHTNYYHKPQFSISCASFKIIED